MFIKDIVESSPDTPRGSVTRDLIISKLWLCKCLETLGLTRFDDVYVLGSWYGATAVVIKSLPFEYHDIFCIDSDSKNVEYFQNIIDKKGYQDVQSICQDANDIDYTSNNILVINSSTNDIAGTQWLDIIPRRAVVALQGKNQQEESNGIETLQDFDHEYSLAETLFVGELEVTDVNGAPYTRFMKIGIK